MEEPQNETNQEMGRADPERLNGYIDMFDRMLLYNLAAGAFPPHIIDEIVAKWVEITKTTIDMESKHRTHFLESSPQGRLAKKQNQPDGEDLRLLCLDTLDMAKQIVTRNLQRDEKDSEFGD